VKETRAIYPVPLTVLACQLAVFSHISSYITSSEGTYEPSSYELAACFSSGFDQSVGSRILDDMNLIYYSGNPNIFTIAIDYSGYDYHCVYSNFRKPMIAALKECLESDDTDFNGYSRSELVDKAYGHGRMHNTLWNIGRKVVRADITKIRELQMKSINEDDNVKFPVQR